MSSQPTNLIKQRTVLLCAIALILLPVANASDSDAVYSTGHGISLNLPGLTGQQTRISAAVANPGTKANASAPMILLTEDFEDTFPSGAWATTADGLSGCSWAKTNAKADASANSASPVAIGCSSPIDVVAGPLPDNTRISMSYGPFDLSGKTSASLNFRHAIQLEGGDRFYFGHINDPDSDCIGTYTVNGISGGNLSWQSDSLDLFSQLGNTHVCIAFVLVADDVAAAGVEAVFVDNIEIVTGDVDADLAVTLVDVSNGTYAPGDIINVRSIVENLGTETSSTYDIGFFLSPDSNVTTEDFYLGGFFENPGIVEGIKDDFTDPFRLPTNLPTADWYIGASIETTIDTNPNNNANHDSTPITVRTQGEILIRPTTLRIFEQAPASLSAVHTRQTTQSQKPQKNRVAKPTVSQSRLQDLMRIVQERKQVRLLVGINTGFAPEATLSNNAIQRQRGKISTAMDRLMVDLKPYTTQLKNRFRTIPYIALQVDESALIHLSNSPLVSSIKEDTLRRPTLASSNIVIGSPLAWAEGMDGSGWAVAVLDTGVDKSHDWFGTDGNKVISEACYNTVSAGVSESFCPAGAESLSQCCCWPALGALECPL